MTYEKRACCQGKPPFTSMKKAQKVAKRMRRELKEPLDAYRCPACRKIHVGHAK